MSNRLASESSPYLLQHKDNPVDWYPWGEEALGKARKEDKPIFLSIGYSTCHWCHVMERESFEDDEVADLMNEAFISIKVDREERPDLDSIYMSVCQLVGGSCGWPLNVVMTSKGEPFFVGTYFPKRERGGRIGMVELIPRIADAWKNDRERIVESADNIVAALSKLSDASLGSIDKDWTQLAEAQLLRSHDRVNGGFGARPKFPSPHNLLFLMRGEGDLPDAVAGAVATTLDRMATGGFHDHVGGGFHRYSTDSEWRLPHFEKMLYDQAMLLLAYTEGWRRTGNSRYKQVSERLVEYVRRDLSSDDGTFYAAEDADSEGVEGKFYVWSQAEFATLTSESVAELFDIRKDGNFEEEATGRFTGENVLHMTRADHDFSRDENLYDPLVLKAFDRLLDIRSDRVRPGLDTKILVDWNGLMIGALARAGRTFGKDAMTELAVTAARAIQKSYTGRGTLPHLHRSEKKVEGMLDDHAFLCFAAIELYLSTSEPGWLEMSINLAEDLNDLFADPDSGRLFLTSSNSAGLIIRPMDINDGAMPSGNAVAADCYVRLYRLTGKTEWSDRAQMIFEGAAENVGRYPSAFTALVHATHSFLTGGREIAVVGAKDNGFVQLALGLLRGATSAETVLHFVDTNDEQSGMQLLNMVDYLEPMMEGLTPAVYICDNFACQMPIKTEEELRAAL